MRRRRRTLQAVLLAAACLALVGFPPVASAHWNSVLQYAQGYGGAGGSFFTTGYDHRHFNRVWHKQGTLWCVSYVLTDGTGAGQACGTANPTQWPGDIGYAKAKCLNGNDNSAVLWTCETTT